MSSIAAFLAELAASFPAGGAADWDFTGLQLGDGDRPVQRVAVCHEVTEAVVGAIEADPPDLLLSYHPLLFTPTRQVVAGRSPDGRAYRLIRAGVALAVVHTAFDVAPGGAAEALAAALALERVEGFAALPPANPDGAGAPAYVGRVGHLAEPRSLADFSRAVAAALDDPPMRVSPGERIWVDRVAVIPGSGASFIGEAVAAGADVLVTGDVSHHRVIGALDRGMAVIDAGHAPTERPGIRALVDIIASRAATIDLVSLDPTPWR
jgi:dinuclear metal center YbgI/SA1388 family protein